MGWWRWAAMAAACVGATWGATDRARAEGSRSADASAAARASTAPSELPKLEVQEVAHSGSMPKGTTRSHDGTRYYVTNFGQLDRRSVTIFDAITLTEVGHIDLPGVVVESVLSPDGKTLYVSNFRRGSVMFVDLATKSLAREVRVGTCPKILAITHDGKRLFSANWASDDVTEIDVAAGTVTRTLKTGKSPRGMVVARDGTLYVANFYSKSIDVFRGPDMSDRHRIGICENPRHLALSPNHKVLYITCLHDSELHAMDRATETIAHKVGVGTAPKTVSISDDGRYAYTADYGTSRSISVVDTQTWAAQTFAVPGMDRGSGVAASADGKRALVTGWYDGHVYLVGFEGTGGHPNGALQHIRGWRHRPHHADPGDGIGHRDSAN